MITGPKDPEILNLLKESKFIPDVIYFGKSRNVYKEKRNDRGRCKVTVHYGFVYPTGGYPEPMTSSIDFIKNEDADRYMVEQLIAEKNEV